MPANISTILISASRQKVWDALTRQELVKRWQFGSDLITSWEPGTDIRFRTEWNGQVFKQWGKILEIRPLELIRYSLFAPRPGLEDKPEYYFVMQYELSGEDRDVTLQITQEDNRPGAVQEAPQGEENPVLQSLRQVAEE
jgi:uncharacterized protein YndB with AHSA1/START domain